MYSYSYIYFSLIGFHIENEYFSFSLPWNIASIFQLLVQFAVIESARVHVADVSGCRRRAPMRPPGTATTDAPFLAVHRQPMPINFFSETSPSLIRPYIHYSTSSLLLLSPLCACFCLSQFTRIL